MRGKLAVDTNAVIAYREGIVTVCTLIEGADILFLPVVVVMGELLYGALNSAKPKKNHGAPNLFILSPNIISFIGVALEGVIRYRKPQTRNSINNL